MTPEIEKAMAAYIAAEGKLQTRREVESRIKRKTYINGTTGKTEHEVPSAEILERTAEAQTKRDITFQDVVREVRQIPLEKLQVRAKTAQNKFVRKVLKEAIRTIKSTNVVIPIPTTVYDYLSDNDIDVGEICLNAVKRTYQAKLRENIENEAT